MEWVEGYRPWIGGVEGYSWAMEGCMGVGHGGVEGYRPWGHRPWIVLQSQALSWSWSCYW